MALLNYIAEGFMEDCEELIHTITEKFEKVEWKNFCHFWKEMEFDMLFYGRQSGPEVVEFTEELLQTARLYLITETDNFESQVIGLFIAYAITLIQPYKNLVSLRVVPADIAPLKKFEAKLREDSRMDVLYILGKMYIFGKTQFHVALRERAMDMSIRKYFDGSINVPVCVTRRWHGVLDRTRIRSLENIAQEEDEYMNIKMQAKLAAEATFPGTKVQVDLFKPEARKKAESLRKLTTKAEDNEKTKSDDESCVNKVKQKAMKKVVDPMKHLHSVFDRKKDQEKKPPAPSKPSPKTYKYKHSKETLPKRSAEPITGFSLPALDDPIETKNYLKSEDFEAPFKGFSREEIESCPYNQNSPTKLNDCSHSNDKSEGNSSLTDQSPIKKQYIGRSPRYKRKYNNDKDTKRKKYKIKNKLNKKLKLTNDFNSDDSDTSTDNNYESEESTNKNEIFDLGKENKDAIKVTTEIFDRDVCKKEKNTINNPVKKLHAKIHKEKEKKPTKEVLSKNVHSDMCKSKEVTIQSKGVVKHFVEFEVNENIVIRTEKDAPPLKDIEIEYIDNYTATNTYEEMCEVSDDDDTKNEKSDKQINVENKSQNIETAENENGDANDVELFEVVNNETDLKISECTPSCSNAYTGRLSSVNDRQTDMDENVKRILSRGNTKNIDRRKLKQPSLRSKWKKLGLLSIANFDDDSN